MRRGLLVALSLAPLTAAGQEGPPTLSDVLADDSTLHDVAFADQSNGWAVGDRGVVLATTTGGRHWLRVPTPTEAPLHGVSFVDAQHGWAVGGLTRPYTHESRGVVLATDNGGRDWREVSTGVLPRLRSVRFFDQQHGVAAGDGTALSPSGLYTTDDGGRHWRPVPGSQARQWLAADFTLDPVGEYAGVAAGLRGAAARVSGRHVTLSTTAGERRGAHGVALVDAARGWLVGDGGMVRVTDDGGQAWGAPPSDPPAALNDWFDWRTVAARGPKVWIAGSPGAVILSSDDAGRTWNTTPTGVTTPIRSLRFLDDSHGWAVGELGVVLATDDGGASWRVQRGAGRRAAVACLVATPEQTPVELVGAAAAAEGYRTVLAAPFLPESTESASPLADRLVGGSSLLGVNSTRLGWAVPLEPADANSPEDVLLERLDRQTDGRAREMLVAELRRLLLTYRPDVLVAPDPESVSDPSTGAAALLLEVATEAVAAAAQAPPPETGLGGWEAKRLLVAAPDDGSPRQVGESLAATGEFSSLLGATPAQWGQAARGLFDPEYAASPAAFRWRTVVGRPAPESRRGDLLAGISSPRGGEARRPAAVASSEQLEQLRRIAAKRRNMERLLAQAEGDPAWAGQVMNLTGGLDAESGAGLLRQLAEGYRAAGRFELAAETLYLLARRYPEAPLADASLLWLVRYYASGERALADSQVAGQDARATDGATPAQQVGGTLQAPDATGVVTAEERLERAATLLDFLRQARPALHAAPSLQMAEAVTQRGRGFGADADKIALLLSKQSIDDSWRRVANAERWLAKPEGLPPEKPIANCRYTPQRPKLDGHFDELFWAAAQAIPLTESEYGKPTTTVRVAHDEEFLFVAIEASADSPEPIDQEVARPRDADLTGFDRLRLRIDTDRDYATAFELAVDARGWTYDSLWGDAHWNPSWWVAAEADHESWCIEAAIPIAEVADPEQIARAAWALSLTRERPGEPAAAWPSARATEGSPDAFGLLLFD